MICRTIEEALFHAQQTANHLISLGCNDVWIEYNHEICAVNVYYCPKPAVEYIELSCIRDVEGNYVHVEL
jgi:hypothetical protein